MPNSPPGIQQSHINPSTSQDTSIRKERGIGFRNINKKKENKTRPLTAAKGWIG